MLARMLKILLPASLPSVPAAAIANSRASRWRRRDGSSVASRSAATASATFSVAQVLAPGGVLVYAVCSILPQEGEQRVERFLAAHPQFELERPREPALEPFLTPGGALRTWPHLHGTDGFFAALFTKS